MWNGKYNYAIFIMCMNKLFMLYHLIKNLVYSMNDLCSFLFRQSRETFITLAKVTLINMFSSCFWSSLSFIFFKSIKENQSLGLFETFKKSISARRFLKHFLSVIRYLYELVKSAVLIQRKKWDINWTQDTTV